MSGDFNKTLFAPSTIRLFGWFLTGFPPPPAPAANAGGLTTVPVNPAQLAAPNASYVGQGGLSTAVLRDPNVRLAYILAYSYAGSFTQLKVPAIFLVSQPAQPVHVAGQPLDPGRFGLAYLDTTAVSFASDLLFWTYNISDPMIRLDPSSGTLQELVIDAETGGSHGRRRIDLVGQDGSFSGRFGGGH